MIGVETSPELVNRIANSAGVGEYIRPDGQPIDFTSLVSERPAKTGVVFLSNGDDAVGVFDITTDRVYQAHVMFSTSCRGKRAVQTGREMIDWMFSHGADVIWGDVPRWNKPTRWFARQMGMKPLDSSDADTEVLEVRKVH